MKKIFLLCLFGLSVVNGSAQPRDMIKSEIVDQYLSLIKDLVDPNLKDDPDYLGTIIDKFSDLFVKDGSAVIYNDFPSAEKSNEWLSPDEYCQFVSNKYENNFYFNIDLVYYCKDIATENIFVFVKKTYKGKIIIKDFPKDKIYKSFWLKFILKYENEIKEYRILKIEPYPQLSSVDVDRDSDGILDDCDQCPRVHGYLSEYGRNAAIDKDGDCIEDARDKCPEDQSNKCKRQFPKLSLTLEGAFGLPLSRFSESNFWKNNNWISSIGNANYGWQTCIGINYTPLKFLGVGLDFGFLNFHFKEEEFESELIQYTGSMPGSISVKSDAYGLSYSTVKILLGGVGTKYGIYIAPQFGYVYGDLTNIISKNYIYINDKNNNSKIDVDFGFNKAKLYGGTICLSRWLGESGGCEFFATYFQSELPVRSSTIFLNNQVPIINTGYIHLKTVQIGVRFIIRLLN